MADLAEHSDTTAELAAVWHATVEAHIAGQLGDCVHRLAEAELRMEHESGAPGRGLAQHLAHALMVATNIEGVGSAVKYLQQVTAVLLESPHAA